MVLKAGAAVVTGAAMWSVCTYGLVADGAKRLKVVQRALSSSAVDWPNVVDLPEIPFDRSADHLVQLETHTERKSKSVSEH